MHICTHTYRYINTYLKIKENLKDQDSLHHCPVLIPLHFLSGPITDYCNKKSPAMRLNVGLLYSSVKHLCQVPSCVNEWSLHALHPPSSCSYSWKATQGQMLLHLFPLTAFFLSLNLTSRLKEQVGSYGNMSEIYNRKYQKMKQFF